MWKRIYLTLVLAILSALLASCGSLQSEKKNKIKNVIFMIGDGMGPQQLALLYHYAKNAKSSIYQGQDTVFEKLADNGVGLHMPHPYGEITIDSAASATQMATGHISRPGMIGLDKDGRSVETILERAKKAGLGTGLVSETRLTHATPASFAAHIISRKMEADIAEQMVATAPDIMLSGGLKFFIPKNAADKKSDFYKKYRSLIPARLQLTSKRADNKNILANAEKNGYSLSFDKSSLMSSKGKKILGLFSEDAMPDGIWFTKNQNNPKRVVPTLQEMSAKAIEVLAQNKKGFFLMIEGGQIDWAAHANDSGALLHSMIHFEKTIAEVIEWAKKRDDTLVIITGDHETGSFGFSYTVRKKIKKTKLINKTYKTKENFGAHSLLDKLYEQKASYRTMYIEFYGLPKQQQNANSFKEIFNRNSQFKISLEEAGLAIERENGWPLIREFRSFYTSSWLARGGMLARILADKQKIVWGTGSHTSTAIPVFTFGPPWLTKKFHGIYNNTRLYDLTKEALGL